MVGRMGRERTTDKKRRKNFVLGSPSQYKLSDNTIRRVPYNRHIIYPNRKVKNLCKSKQYTRFFTTCRVKWQYLCDVMHQFEKIEGQTFGTYILKGGRRTLVPETGAQKARNIEISRKNFVYTQKTGKGKNASNMCRAVFISSYLNWLSCQNHYV